LMFTHLAVTLLIVMLFRLDENEAFVALLFGVFIDIDHLFGYVDYITTYGVVGAVDAQGMLDSDVQWKSLMHNPVTVIVVAPVAIAFRYAVPLLCWVVHLTMDWAQIEILGIASPLEMLILFGSIAGIWYIRARDYRDLKGSYTLAGHVHWELDGLGDMVSRVMPGDRSDGSEPVE